MGWQDAPVVSKGSWRDAPVVKKPVEPFVPSGDKTSGWVGGLLGYDPKALGITPAENIAGHPITRFAMGAAAPILGLTQMGAEALGDKTGTETLKADEALRKTGQEAMGGGSFDLTGLAGTVLSPAILKVAKALNTPASVLKRAGQGAAFGAGTAASMPVTEGENFWGSKGAQAGTGAVLGAAAPVAGALGKTGYEFARNVVDPILPGGATRSAARMLAEAVKGRQPSVERLWRHNATPVPGSQGTAAEVAAPAGSTELSGLQSLLAKKFPTMFNDIEVGQEAARRAALGQHAGDKKMLADAIARRDENAREVYGAIRNTRIGPESNAEIMSRAIKNRAASKASALQDEGRFATTAAQQEELAGNFVPVPGMPRVAGRLSANAERVPEARSAAADAKSIAALRRQEEDFLESTMELLRDTVGLEKSSLTELLRRPSMRDAVQDAIKSSQETGAYFPRKAGEQFSLQNLQRMKESLDAGIRAAKASADAGKRPQLSPSELMSTKNAFVEWLSSRSPQWKNARLQYMEDSLPINKMQVGQELEKALTTPLGTAERPGAFASAVQNAPRTIKRATGNPRFDEISQVDPALGKTADAVLADLNRQSTSELLGRLGQSKAAEITGAPGLPATGPLHQDYMIFKTILGRISKGTNEKSIEQLANALRTPKEALDLIKHAPPAKRQAMIDALLSRYAAAGTSAVTAQQEQF